MSPIAKIGNVKIYNGNLEDNNKTDSICSLSENSLNAYPNCAYIYNNPYLVNKIIDDKNYCVIADNIYPLQNNNLNSEYKIGDTWKETHRKHKTRLATIHKPSLKANN